MHEVDGSSVPRPVLYDSSMLTKTQRSYGTYKRELLGIFTFAKKYSYMFSTHRGKLMTDHKPLTTFLGSLYVEGIYARWAAELILLNFDILHVPGPRNQVADALSRTIFLDPDCEMEEALIGAGEMDEKDGQPKWVWKDGAGGYAEFLRKQRVKESEEAERLFVGQGFGGGRILDSGLCSSGEAGLWGNGPLSIDEIVVSNLIAASQSDDQILSEDTERKATFVPHAHTIDEVDEHSISR
ncbi:hypothetical protein K3495_g16691, partial [Podosphaera aphanis]